MSSPTQGKTTGAFVLQLHARRLSLHVSDCHTKRLLIEEYENECKLKEIADSITRLHPRNTSNGGVLSAKPRNAEPARDSDFTNQKQVCRRLLLLLFFLPTMANGNAQNGISGPWRSGWLRIGFVFAVLAQFRTKSRLTDRRPIEHKKRLAHETRKHAGREFVLPSLPPTSFVVKICMNASYLSSFTYRFFLLQRNGTNIGLYSEDPRCCSTATLRPRIKVSWTAWSI